MKQRLIIIVIATVLKAISPLLRQGLDTLIKSLYAKALETDTDADDVLVEALADLLDVDLDK